MKLYGTYPSHFTRKVRILLLELGVPFEFVLLTNLMGTGSQHFAGNPLHMLPVLEHEGKTIIESDIICEYLIEHFGAQTGFKSFLPEPKQRFEDLKRLAIMNGVMASGVKLIRALRSEIPNYENFPFFQQEKNALHEGLLWLNQDLANFKSKTYYPKQITMLDITLISLCEWAIFRNMIPDLSAYPRLAQFVEENKSHPSFASTHPAVVV